MNQNNYQKANIILNVCLSQLTIPPQNHIKRIQKIKTQMYRPQLDESTQSKSKKQHTNDRLFNMEQLSNAKFTMGKKDKLNNKKI